MNINQYLHIVEKAISWQSNVPDSERQNYLEQLVNLRRAFKKIQFAASERCSTAAFGESQMGKSYLVSALMSDPGKPFTVTDGRREYNFIDDINPSTPNSRVEATGVVTRFTISQIAMMADTSVAAVLRFCKHLGFGGYKGFRSEIMIWQRQNIEIPAAGQDTVSALAHRYSEAIGALSELDRHVLNRLCKDIIGAKRVVILGRYRTSTAAEKLRMNLIDLGLTAITGTNTLDFQHLLYIIDENTAVIMFSTTGEVTDQKEFLSQLDDQTEKIWLITPVARAKMSAYAAHTIELPKVPVNQVFAGSQTVMMAFADILTAVLSEYSGR